MLATARFWINHPITAYRYRKVQKNIHERVKGILDGSIRDSMKHDFKHRYLYCRHDWPEVANVKDCDYYIAKMSIELNALDWEVYKHELYLERLRLDRARLLREEADVKIHMIEQIEGCNIVS